MKQKRKPCNCLPNIYLSPDSMTKICSHETYCDSHNFQRQTWDEYFLELAQQVATRGTCDRKQVGAIIVRDKTILATGYNGSIRGDEHCDDVGHLMENDHCVRTIHAEQNAIIQAAKNGTSIDKAEIYITCSPCWICFKMLANAGITKITFSEFYRDEKIFQAAQKLGIELNNKDES